MTIISLMMIHYPSFVAETNPSKILRGARHSAVLSRNAASPRWPATSENKTPAPGQESPENTHLFCTENLGHKLIKLSYSYIL